MNTEQLIQLQTTGRIDRGVETTTQITNLLADRDNTAVAIGVSGGKDSCAAAIATVEHLRHVGHEGPVVLIHSDLGRVEWKDSLPTCERLAERLGVELMVVRRAAGDTGVRRDESPGRKTKPTLKVQPKLSSAKHETFGYDWLPIAHWTSRDVYTFLKTNGFELHEAYTRYGLSRVSCAFCIMSSQADLLASTRCDENVPLYREMVDLEIESTFAFQGEHWLADTAPHLLTDDQRDQLERAKAGAIERRAAEARIPDHLLYTEGWPTCMPTRLEADLIAQVRSTVGAVVGLPVEHTTAASVLARYAELIELKAQRDR